MTEALAEADFRLTGLIRGIFDFPWGMPFRGEGAWKSRSGILSDPHAHAPQHGSRSSPYGLFVPRREGHNVKKKNLARLPEMPADWSSTQSRYC